jgi:serine/threonine protein kinase
MTTLANAVIGEYRLLESLGAGGMGEVYRAVHSRIGRVVAIKILSRAEPGLRLAERFVNEARIQAGLHHPILPNSMISSSLKGVRASSWSMLTAFPP